MALILHLETATSNLSVGLSRDGRLLDLLEVEGQQHARSITVFVEDIIKKQGLSLSALDAVSLSAGPGSYTGLRIGAACAKGLCFALDKPLIAVDTLEAMVGSILKNVSTEDLLVPVMDARRMEVYGATFDSKGKRLSPTRATVLSKDAFLTMLEGKVLFFGSGSAKLAEFYSFNSGVRFSPHVNSAEGLIKTAETKFEVNDFENLAYFEPNYLKPFFTGKPV